MTGPAPLPRVAVREGLLTTPLDDLDSIRLLGCRCGVCGETALGRRPVCANCGSESVEEIPLARDGTLWTYTVVRHRPPGNYRGADPFVPFGLGLVELPDGLRVMSPVDGPVEQLHIGMPVRFKAAVWRETEREVIAFSFQPAGTGAR